MNKQSAVSLFVILLIALGLRLGWGLSRDAGDDAVFRSLPDQREYLELGRNLLHRHELVMHEARLDVDVRAFRTPGYPILIAACGGSVRAVRLAQALLDTSTVLAIFLLARTWLALRGSLLAAVIIAIDPFLIYFSALILSETFFIALLAWGMLLLTRRSWWIGALILSLSILVRPGAIALPTVLALLAARDRKILLRAAVAALLTIVVLFPWAWRNHRVVGEWVWTSTNSGFTMYDGFQRGATGASDQVFVIYMRRDLIGKSEVERSAYLSGLARHEISSHPIPNILLAARKIFRTWTPVPLSKEYGGNVTLIVISLAYTLPLFALVIAGLLRNALPAPAKLLLMAPALYFTVAAALSVGSLRYRVPADVSMTIIAASALARRAEPSPQD